MTDNRLAIVSIFLDNADQSFLWNTNSYWITQIESDPIFSTDSCLLVFDESLKTYQNTLCTFTEVSTNNRMVQLKEIELSNKIMFINIRSSENYLIVSSISHAEKASRSIWFLFIAKICFLEKRLSSIICSKKFTWSNWNQSEIYVEFFLETNSFRFLHQIPVHTYTVTLEISKHRVQLIENSFSTNLLNYSSF